MLHTIGPLAVERDRARYDAIVLGVHSPGKDGFAVARAIRASSTATPILMLTSRDTVEDTIVGLDAGADDYLRKPFVFGELHERLRSLARRTAPPASAVLRVRDLTSIARRVRSGAAQRRLPLPLARQRFSHISCRTQVFCLTQTMNEDAL